MTYQCFNDEPPPNFMLAYRAAGETIERMGQSLPYGPEDKAPYFRWLVTRPQMLFAHLVFAYRNQVFAVYVDVVNRSQSSFTDAHRKRILEAAAEYNLIPCSIRVEVAAPGVNNLGVYGSEIVPAGFLTDVRTGERIDPCVLATDKDIPMSSWERRAFAINVLEREIGEKHRYEIGSVCSVIGIDPQIWFKDDKGRPCWCIVREWVGKDDNAPRKQDFYHFADQNLHLKSYDGFFAGVSVSSAETVVCCSSGEIIPLSKRFTPDCPLFRGHKMYVSSQGLERIYVAG